MGRIPIINLDECNKRNHVTLPVAVSHPNAETQILFTYCTTCGTLTESTIVNGRVIKIENYYNDLYRSRINNRVENKEVLTEQRSNDDDKSV